MNNNRFNLIFIFIALFLPYAISVFGDLYVWGSSSQGQLGLGSFENQITPIKLELPNGEVPKFISAGEYSSYIVTAKGDVYALGAGIDENGFTQNNNSKVNVPTLVKALEGKKVLQFTAGTCHFLALTNYGEVYSWGCNDHGSLGRGSMGSWSSVPKKLDFFKRKNIRQIVSGYHHSAALTDNGLVYVWGSGFCGEIGNGGYMDHNKPVLVESLKHTRICQISSGSEHMAALDTNGKLYTWGCNEFGQLGNGMLVERSAQVELVERFQYPDSVAFVSCGTYFTSVITTSNKVFLWGKGGESLPREEKFFFDNSIHPRQISSGENHIVVVTSNYDVYGWGENFNGEIANGNNKEFINEPKLITDISSTRQGINNIVSGSHHVLAMSGTPPPSTCPVFIHWFGEPGAFYKDFIAECGEEDQICDDASCCKKGKGCVKFNDGTFGCCSTTTNQKVQLCLDEISCCPISSTCNLANQTCEKPVSYYEASLIMKKLNNGGLIPLNSINPVTQISKEVINEVIKSANDIVSKAENLFSNKIEINNISLKTENPSTPTPAPNSTSLLEKKVVFHQDNLTVEIPNIVLRVPKTGFFKDPETNITYRINDGVVTQVSLSPRFSSLSSKPGTANVGICGTSKITCPDSSCCEKDQTCCRNGQNNYGCCPISYGVCCIDHTHCCPEGFTCDNIDAMCTNSSNPKSTTLMYRHSKREIGLCKNGDHACHDGSCCQSRKSCCSMFNGLQGCAPWADAVCCRDGKHACPSGSVCNLKTKRCVDIEMEMDVVSDLGVLEPSHMPPGVDLACHHNELACGNKTCCKSDFTCCKDPNGFEKCCPYPGGFCCKNSTCCPITFSCDIYGVCTSLDGEYAERKMTVEGRFPNLVVEACEISEFQCPSSQSCCPKGQACCDILIFNGEVGQSCCPLGGDSICCKDDRCCPSDHSCVSMNGSTMCIDDLGKIVSSTPQRSSRKSSNPSTSTSTDVEKLHQKVASFITDRAHKFVEGYKQEQALKESTLQRQFDAFSGPKMINEEMKINPPLIPPIDHDKSQE